MNGKELLSKLLLSINAIYGMGNNDVIDSIDIDDNLLDGISKLKALNLNGNIIIFLIGIELIITKHQTIEDSGVSTFLSDPYNVNGNPETIDFTLPELVKKNRSFAHNNNEFSFFSTKNIFDNGILVNLAEAKHSILWECIQKFCERCYHNVVQNQTPQLIIEFLSCIENCVLTKGFFVNKNSIHFLPEKHYSFIYFDFLNDSNSITLSSNLTYNTTKLNQNFSFDSGKVYEQYFDIYDVLNELNQSSDIINRFLKLYHILEYLVYRVYLVEIVGRLGINKIFVREFINASENMSKNESSSFLKNFKKIFDNESLQISLELAPHNSPAVTAELIMKKIVKAFNHTNLDNVASLIYGIRCGIVHNKEGEYHFTLSNAEDFEIIIPLIRQIITTFESLVVFKLMENDVTIHYPSRKLNLY